MTQHNSSPIAPITEEDIVEFLTQTPSFFERHAQWLGSVQLSSPHGARAVSLQERQVELLRDKIKGMEQRTMEMVRHSTENADIARKLVDWTGDVLAVKDPIELPHVIARSLCERFAVPQAALRVWDVAPEHAAQEFAQGASDEVRALATSLATPYCGSNLGFDPLSWLHDASSVQSVALLPLRGAPAADGTAAATWGLLVLGSPDAKRFVAEMGTDFLLQIASLSAAALSRLRS